MPTKIEALSEQQSALLSDYAERWAAERLATAPVDRAAAEEGVRLAYRTAGLPPPRQICWSEGPLELAQSWARTRNGPIAGANRRAAIFDRTRTIADLAVAARVAPRVRRQIHSRAMHHNGMAVSRAVMQAVASGIDNRSSMRGPWLWRALASTFRVRRSFQTWATFGQSGYCQHELDWLNGYRFLAEACDMRFETEGLAGVWLVAANSGWIVPHEGICWLSERHGTLHLDDRGRLHRADGPALGYPDGWQLHAWKGIIVPAELIEHPETITLERIDAERDIFVRRCLIEMMTPRKFIELGGATRVASDETGVLWLKTWWAGDAWAAVEVVNGTPEPDGRRQRYYLQVPPEFRTARAAVAWTYGMSEVEYSRLAVRT